VLINEMCVSWRPAGERARGEKCSRLMMVSVLAAESALCLSVGAQAGDWMLNFQSAGDRDQPSAQAGNVLVILGGQ
jgi:hypothetical protein